MADTATSRIPLIADVDTGIDDSLALLYLMASPEAEILAITCTAGITTTLNPPGGLATFIQRRMLLSPSR